jgi:threonine dehydrogenase-like Zn-dependent dehydrogenase
MKQVFIRKGSIRIEDVPAPARQPNNILVEITHSVISTGTELSTLKNASSVRADRVNKVWESVKVRGVARTMDLIKEKMETLEPLGYSCAGRVIAVGSAVRRFKVGDRVACGGAGWANHAEIVSVPENLATAVPPSVSDTFAAYTTLGAIALQGVRRADVRLGETACVIGLGLIGQLTVQLLRASGCTVIGFDTDKSRSGDDGVSSPAELIKRVQQATSAHGVDTTIITASTSSSDPANMAFDITRKKGRVVVVGAVGMDLKRSPFYEKEQDFLISCSYGPGRYDPDYELNGQDYPYAYVRWTENRNMSGFLDLVANGKIFLQPLIGAELPLSQAEEAYDKLSNGTRPLSILLTSIPTEPSKSSVIVQPPVGGAAHDKVRLGLIGVGDFVRSTHIPNLKRLHETVDIYGVCSSRGHVAAAAAKRLRATLTTTDPNELLKNPDLDAVLIATRHNQHAQMAEAALKAGKHVFLEKPLALEVSELEALEKTINALRVTPVLVVGFNRRFSPLAVALKEKLKNRN